MIETVMAVVRPIHDQRRLISSRRPCGPAAPSMTTGNRTIPIVEGIAATAQIATISGTTTSRGATATVRPISA